MQTRLNGGAPPYLISPQSQIVSEFTRPFFPHFFRQGGWSAGQFVMDANGLTLPAVTATGSTAAGWINLPFEAGETVVGASLTICGDGTTSINVDTWGTRWTTDQQSHSQDYLRATGSGGPINHGAVWGVIDIQMLPLLMQQNSTLWMSIAAMQLSTAVPTPPPSMAISQITLYLNH